MAGLFLYDNITNPTDTGGKRNNGKTNSEKIKINQLVSLIPENWKTAASQNQKYHGAGTD